MFFNYLTTAIRNISKHKGYSLINITGLAVGIASAVLILLYVQDELSYDRFHEKSEQIYRVGLHGTIAGNEMKVGITSAPMAQTLVNEYPEVLNATRLFTFAGSPVVKYNEKSFVVEKYYFADSTFFDVFTVEFINGDPKTALNRSNTMILTRKTAEKIFGTEDPVGKTLLVGNDKEEFEVTGVVKEFPGNSHFNFDILTSIVSMPGANSPVWVSNNFVTYIVLQKGFDYHDLEAKFPELVKTYVGPQLAQFANTTLEEFFEAGNQWGYFLQKLTDLHFSDLEFEIEPGGDMKHVYIFSVIAFFLIVIACINFMNLATAKSAGRALEVGIRKVAGASRKGLILQFLTESVILTFISLVLAIVLATLLIPSFNNIASKTLALNLLSDPLILSGIILIGLIVSLLSGSYPAVYLSAFKPVKVLKGSLKSGAKNSRLRSILVVIQFSIAIFLIISTIVVYRQMNFIQNKDLGYDKENLLIIQRAYALQDQRETFIQELEKNSGIESVTLTNFFPGSIMGNTAYKPEGSTADDIRSINITNVDDKYHEVLNLKINRGRWFSRDRADDSTAVILNEAAVKALGFEDPLNKKVMLLGGGPDNTDLPLQIIGVVKDFHYQSLHQTIKPLVIHYNRNEFGQFIGLKIHPENYQESINLVQKQWDTFVKDQPLEYSFLEDELASKYDDDRKTGIIFSIFAIIAILVSCLGLFGLASYTAEQRTKEIGIRKVMGASVPVILLLLSREIIILMSVSTLISWPAAYFFTKNWLQNFAFRINPGVLTFFIASLVALVIAMITVSYRTYRASKANPADSLRHE
ncbi:MAG: ABC transporter permease [Bacteroidales bacterium]|nr:ABC transporter permease [Bacteroidales bacterium]